MSFFNRGEMSFSEALESMKMLGQNFQPVKAPWIIFRVEDGVIEKFHELKRVWEQCHDMPCDWIMGKWVEV